MKESEKAPRMFAERVKTLREKRGWTQTDLAEHARLAPAALSRILSGERPPRMEHLIDLASCLEITVAELVSETEAASVILDWVPRSRYEDAERARVEFARERDVARADLAARTLENSSLKKALDQTHGRLASAERRQDQMSAELRKAHDEHKELVELRGRTVELEALRDGLEGKVAYLEREVETSRSASEGYLRQWEDAHGRMTQLQADLLRAKNGQIAVGAVGSALGMFLGAMINDPPRRRRS